MSPKGKWARGIVPRNFHWIVKDQLPGAVNQAVSGYIAANFPNATPAQIAQLRPVLTAQFTPIVSQAINNTLMQTLTNYEGSPKGWNLYLRHLYFQAKPVKGLEQCQFRLELAGLSGVA